MPAPPAERMRQLRVRRRRDGLREIRLVVPDTRLPVVRDRIRAAIEGVNPVHEAEALDWIEAVSGFEESEAR